MSWSSLVAMMLAGVAAPDTIQFPVRPAASVDLARYAGVWHEVARFPNRFQRDCAGPATAEYTLLPDGQIRVVNQCPEQDGEIKRAEGRAKLADADGPSSVLKVRFAPRILSFLPFVWGDYWILDLADDYTAALVGDPGREYLWVLSRAPRIDESVYARMVGAARAQGFDVGRLVRQPVSP